MRSTFPILLTVQETGSIGFHFVLFSGEAIPPSRGVVFSHDIALSFFHAENIEQAATRYPTRWMSRAQITDLLHIARADAFDRGVVPTLVAIDSVESAYAVRMVVPQLGLSAKIQWLRPWSEASMALAVPRLAETPFGSKLIASELRTCFFGRRRMGDPRGIGITSIGRNGIPPVGSCRRALPMRCGRCCRPGTP